MKGEIDFSSHPVKIFLSFVSTTKKVTSPTCLFVIHYRYVFRGWI